MKGMIIRSNPDRTRERVRMLEEYVRAELLSAEGSFICTSFEQCRSSRCGYPFYPGQMSHVGKHYDLEVNGRAMRIVLAGQEYGREFERVDLADRSRMICESARAGFGKDRNPHMKGVASTLRLLLGRDLGDDDEGERLLGGHIFDGFALVNYLLCTALAEVRGKNSRFSGKGYSSPRMQRNCARHFLRTMEVLEPTVIVVHGLALRRWIGNALPLPPPEGEIAEMVEISGRPVDLLTFAHPSAGGHSGWWGTTPRTRYLRKTVAPAIRDFRRRTQPQG